jgi:cell division protease FtsH
VIAAVVTVALDVWFVSHSAATRQPPIAHIPYIPTFLGQVSSGNVASIASRGSTAEGSFRAAVRYPERAGEATQSFATEVPTFVDTRQLSALPAQHGVVLKASPPDDDSSSSTFLDVLFGVLPLTLLGGLLWLMLRRGGGMGTAGSFGRSRARRVEAASTRRSA